MQDHGRPAERSRRGMSSGSPECGTQMRRQKSPDTDRAGGRTPGGRPARERHAFALCASLLRAGDPAATDALDTCLTRHPGHAEGWQLLGDTLFDLGRHEAALVCFGRAHRAAPTANAALRIGVTLRALGRPLQARKAFAEAVASAPNSVRARFLLGVAAQDLGDHSAAAEAYEAALVLDPGLGEAALNLGTARQAAGNLAGARAAYGQAARLRPDGFARAAQSLTTESTGELWLDLGALHRALEGA